MTADVERLPRPRDSAAGGTSAVADVIAAAQPQHVHGTNGSTVRGWDDYEDRRVAVVRSFDVIAGDGEAFDSITRLAAQLCGTPFAMISLVDADWQWLLSRVGIQQRRISREDSICAQTLQTPELVVIPDARLDTRFASNALVAGPAQMRFYAGAPLTTDDGFILGRLCVMDRRARTLTPDQGEHLTALAQQIMALLALRQEVHRLGAELAKVPPPTDDAAGAVSGAALEAFDSDGGWRQLFDASPVGIGVSDEFGFLVAANPALCDIFGRAQAEVIGHRPSEFTHPDDLDLSHDAISLLAASDEPVVSVEKRYLHRDGTVRWAALTITYIPGPQGKKWMLAHVQDVTERTLAAQAAKESESNLAAVARVIQLMQSGSDARQTIVNAARELADASLVALLEPTSSRAELRVTAATNPDVLTMTVPVDASSATAHVFMTGEELFLADPHQHPLVSHALLSQLGVRSLYIVPVRAGDSTSAVLVVCWKNPVLSLDDSRVGVITLLADQAGVAMRQVALLSELETLALTDPLTDLPNRRSWDQTLGQLLTRTSASGQPLTVALVDLDHFKRFNDTFGHAAGDDLLRAFATQARTMIRGADTIARWGGEEFAVALPNCPGHEAAIVLDRLRAAMPGGQTCSIGFGTWDGLESAAALMTRIDAALYEAKAAGRDRIRNSVPVG